MRWPLRNQMLLPMAGLMLGTLIVVSLLNAYWAASRARERIEQELGEVAATLADASFPLTDGVLQKMRGLSGAEFVLVDRQQKIIAASSNRTLVDDLPEARPRDASQSLELDEPATVAGVRFFHATLDLKPTRFTGRPLTLHILYPEKSYRSAWRTAVYPPIVVGMFAMALVFAVGAWMASRVTRPLQRLQSQVNEIAGGEFRSLPVPTRDDEIADLSRSVNRMSQMLAQYEDQVRRSEQLRTLGQLGGGIAHQMRNAATGCRIAVQLHARDCPLGSESENLDVALRQLQLMERYLQRFLSLGRRDEQPHDVIDLADVVDEVTSLVGPTAKHVDVLLEWNRGEGPYGVVGDADALEQLLINLLLNAIEAAADGRASDAKSVRIGLERMADRVKLEVSDTGVGPEMNLNDRMFDPFVTTKSDGTGLGLAVTRETAQAHQGEVTWHRRNGTTHFVVDLPAASIAESKKGLD